MSEAWEAYGRLREGLHLTGYSFERACEHLEWLLVDDRWALGGRFADVNVFMDSIRLDQFRAVAEQRKRIALRIKELQPDVSNRRIASALGVSHQTVNNDLSGKNLPRDTSHSAENEEGDGKELPLSTPARLTGVEAAKKIARFEEGPIRRAERREQRLAQITNANPPLPFGRRWPAQVSDPAWRWEAWSRETGLDIAPEAHFETMFLDELKALEVPAITADDAVHFMWATVPIEKQAHDLLEAWGFTYKSQIIWDKMHLGTGYWVRNQHEILLIGTKGKFPAPLPGTQCPSIIRAPVGRYGEKPAAFMELIERWYPEVPKIELFCRRKPRPGWAPWGNEAEPRDGHDHGGASACATSPPAPARDDVG